MVTSKKKEPLPPHVRPYRTTCDSCGRTYYGNFPMWVQIGPFPCICGATVPAPKNQPTERDGWR